MKEICPVDVQTVDAVGSHVGDVPGTIGEGKWLKIKDGITIGSGSSAFVMPTQWLPGIPIEESPGSRRGQTFVGATGNAANNDGQRTLQFITNEGQGRSMKMQCSSVNKCLGSVGGMADAGNIIIFMKDGGVVVPEDRVKIILPKDISVVTKFNRVGMVYRMDAWVKKDDVQDKGFQGRGGQ